MKNKTDTGLIIGVGAVVAIFVFGNKLLQLFGLSQNKNDRDFNAYADNPNSFWNPGMYENAPAGVKLLTSATCEKMWKDLVLSFGIFNDDENAAIAVFKNNIRYQVQLSFFSWYVAKYKGFNLLNWLKGEAYPNDRLDTTEIAEITNFVKQLPAYK